MGIERIYLNLVKAIYDKPPANIIISGEKLKAFPRRSERRQGFTTITQHSFRSSSMAIREEKEIKGIQIGLSYFTASMDPLP